MVDLHCHVLPGVDDGARTEDIALEMCRMAAADGITDLVATPHANSRFAYDRARYLEMLTSLQAKVPELRLHLGCDFNLSYENVQDALQNTGRYTVGASNTLLIEFGQYIIPPNVLEILSSLQECNYRLLITHPERNPILQMRPELLMEMVHGGAAVQLTANALTGFWGKETRKFSETLLKENMVRIIASDAHDATRRKPILSEGRDAAAKIIGASAAQKLVRDNPAAMLANQPFVD